MSKTIQAKSIIKLKSIFSSYQSQYSEDDQIGRDDIRERSVRQSTELNFAPLNRLLQTAIGQNRITDAVRKCRM